jgi:hypothetical protein
MKKEEIVDIIITALQEREVLEGFHKMQNNKAVQIKLIDGTYFNICMAELKKGESFIIPKLR